MWLNLAATAVLVLVVMLAAFGVALGRGRHDGVDVVWGLGFALVAVATLVLSAGDGPAWRRWVVTVLTAAWGLRLAWHIGRRNRGKPEDRRYEKLLAAAPGDPRWYALRRIYLTQGVILWLVSLPVQVAQYGFGGSRIVVFAGVALWLVGFVFESVGDAQLHRFTADPANRGEVLDTGLWRYTRHPNYFGDACVWWGLFLMACHHWIGLVAVVSPVVMTFLLARGTGKPLLERSIANRRPAYAAYVERTSGFFPLPPKK
jgi:steroid 5-alpha reductase family enzyme